MEHGYSNNGHSGNDETMEIVSEPTEHRRAWPFVVGSVAIATAIAGFGGYWLSGGFNKKYDPNMAAKPAASASPVETPSPTIRETIVSPAPTKTVTVFASATPTPTEASSTPSPSVSERPPFNIETQAINVATWNVYHKNDGAIDRTIETKLVSSDIIALQEVGSNYSDLQKLACDACEFALYPEKATDDIDNALLVKKDSFDLLDKSTILAASKDPKKVSKEVAAYTADIQITKAVLRLKGTEQKVVVFATHMPSDAQSKTLGVFKTEKGSEQAVRAYKHTVGALIQHIEMAEQDNDTKDALFVVAGSFAMATNPELNKTIDPSSIAKVLEKHGYHSIYSLPTSNDKVEGGTFRDSIEKRDAIFFNDKSKSFFPEKGRILRNTTDKIGYEKSDHYPVTKAYVYMQAAPLRTPDVVPSTQSAKPTATNKPTPTPTPTATKKTK